MINYICFKEYVEHQESFRHMKTKVVDSCMKKQHTNLLEINAIHLILCYLLLLFFILYPAVGYKGHMIRNSMFLLLMKKALIGGIYGRRKTNILPLPLSFRVYPHGQIFFQRDLSGAILSPMKIFLPPPPPTKWNLPLMKNSSIRL